MITKDNFLQIGQGILRNVSDFTELMNIKSIIQDEISDKLTPQEIQDLILCKKNMTTINKLIAIGKQHYKLNPTDKKAYMISLSIGTIIKEYDWGTEYLQEDGLFNLAKQIMH